MSQLLLKLSTLAILLLFAVAISAQNTFESPAEDTPLVSANEEPAKKEANSAEDLQAVRYEYAQVLLTKAALMSLQELEAALATEQKALADLKAKKELAALRKDLDKLIEKYPNSLAAKQATIMLQIQISTGGTRYSMTSFSQLLAPTPRSNVPRYGPSTPPYPSTTLHPSYPLYPPAPITKKQPSANNPVATPVPNRRKTFSVKVPSKGK